MSKGRYVICLDGERRWCERINSTTVAYWERDEMYGRVQVHIQDANIRDGIERWGTPIVQGGAA
jgi:hypothetical protein